MFLSLKLREVIPKYKSWLYLSSNQKKVFLRNHSPGHSYDKVVKSSIKICTCSGRSKTKKIPQDKTERNILSSFVNSSKAVPNCWHCQSEKRYFFELPIRQEPIVPVFLNVTFDRLKTLLQKAFKIRELQTREFFLI